MVLKKNEAYIIKEINEDVVILNPETGDYFGINSVGAEFMRLIDGIKTLPELIDEMDKLYNVDYDTLSADLSSLADSLIENNILIKIG